VAIEGYIGRPGSGKTYTLTDRLIQAAKRGRQVFANYTITYDGPGGENIWRFTPDQLLDLPPGVIGIDEAHLWFPARMALKLPPSWLAELSQTRKNGWDLFYSAQHEARVDRVVRDVSSVMWLCSAWFRFSDHPSLFIAECYEPEYFRRVKKRISRRLRPFNQLVADSYDTYERITVATHATSDTDVYAKKKGGAGGAMARRSNNGGNVDLRGNEELPDAAAAQLGGSGGRHRVESVA
jgi:Zonular occludens toxin (Zot)